MSTTPAKKTSGCAVCAAPVVHGKLMCLAHWRAVPLPLQMAVNRTWRGFKVAKDREQRAQRLAAYRAARHAAIDAANPTTEPSKESP